MATNPFHYQEPFELGPDTTEYKLITKDYVKTEDWNGHEMLVVDPEALTVIANVASHDCSFMLRREHNEMVAKILSDPEASENDKFVALTMLRNAEIASKGVLPFCQDTGTSICAAYKGQNVWTGCNDEEKISLGVYKTYTENNLRYSQNAPLTMYDEVNTGCNLPAQIDIHATEGNEYNRTVAAEYTFFLAIPVMFGASLLKVVKFGFEFATLELTLLIVGTVVSVVVSLFVLRFLMGYIKKHDFKVFGWYRIVLGIVVLLYFGLR